MPFFKIGAFGLWIGPAANVAARGQLSVIASGTDAARISLYQDTNFRVGIQSTDTDILIDAQNNQKFTFGGTGPIIASQLCNAYGIQTGVLNTGTFDITIPTRRPVRLELMSTSNAKLFRIYYCASDGSTTAAATSLIDTTSGGIVAAGQSATTVRITNSTGATVNIAWSLIVASPAI